MIEVILKISELYKPVKSLPVSEWRKKSRPWDQTICEVEGIT